MRNKIQKRKHLFSFEKLESRAMMAVAPIIPTDAFDTAPLNNDTQAQGVALANLGLISGQAVFSGLTMEDAADWYAFTMPLQGDASSFIKIDFLHSQGDLELALYTPRGTRIRNSATLFDVEGFSIQNLAAVDATGLPITYSIRVTGFNRAPNPNYTLTINTAKGPIVDPSIKSIDVLGGLLNADDSGIWGNEITVNSKVRNNGNTATPAGVTVSYYLSRDSKVSSDDILLPQNNFSAVVNFPTVSGKGLSATKTIKLTLPDELPNGWSGSFFYIVQSTDATQLITESNENNNTGQAGRGLDWDPISIFNPLETPQSSYFSIKVQPVGMTPQQYQYFKLAAERWEKIIIGDLPNIQTSPGVIVDDLLITATIAAIDGTGGVLGFAGPDVVRDASLGGLTVTGSMTFDIADIASMEGDGTFLNVITHEMGHILGVGTLWESFGLIQGVNGPYPTYTGPNAIAGFNKVSGFAPVSYIPIEADGGQGTAYSHWDEDLMQNELMTGYSGPGNYQPISAVTIGTLADMGYKVNFNAAEPYNMRALPAPIAGPLIPFPDLPVGAQGNRRSSLRAGEPATGNMNLNGTVNLTSGSITTPSRSSNLVNSTSSRSPLTSTVSNTAVTTTSLVNRNESSEKSDDRKEIEDFFGSLGV